MVHESAAEEPGASVPEPAPALRSGQAPAGDGAAAVAPQGLLRRMEELMAALDADLSQLDADLQAPAAQRATQTPREEGKEPAAARTTAH
jgi:hypothetical protein